MSQNQASQPPLLSFDNFITHWANERPDRLALREDDRALTFAELEERTAKVAFALIAAGLKTGDEIDGFVLGDLVHNGGMARLWSVGKDGIDMPKVGDAIRFALSTRA